MDIASQNNKLSLLVVCMSDIYAERVQAQVARGRTDILYREMFTADLQYRLVLSLFLANDSEILR